MGQVHHSSPKVCSRSLTPPWHGILLLSAVLREARPTGSWTSRPAGHHVERTGVVPGVEREKLRAAERGGPFLPLIFRANLSPSPPPASLGSGAPASQKLAHGRSLSLRSLVNPGMGRG